jgi:hypothetical protein
MLTVWSAEAMAGSAARTRQNGVKYLARVMLTKSGFGTPNRRLWLTMQSEYTDKWKNRNVTDLNRSTSVPHKVKLQLVSDGAHKVGMPCTCVYYGNMPHQY